MCWSFLGFGPRLFLLLSLHSLLLGSQPVHGYTHHLNMLMRYKFKAHRSLQSHVSNCLSGISSWQSHGHLKQKQSEIKLMIPFLCSLLNLSPQSMILHPLQCSRQKLQSHCSFVSVLHSSFIIYQHLSFQPPKCNQCPLLPIFTAATFFQDTTTISCLWITITASSLLKLLLLLPLSNLPRSWSYLYSFKSFSLLKALKYNIYTVKSFKNRNYFISLPLLKIIWMFSIALRKKKLLNMVNKALQ